MPERPKGTRAVQDAVRRAVERTFQSSVGSAGQTRERAQELADEVLRRAEDSAARASRGVREAGSRQRAAAANVGDRVGDRLRDAIAEVTGVHADEVERLRSELASLRARVDELEGRLKAEPGAQSARKKST